MKKLLSTLEYLLSELAGVMARVVVAKSSKMEHDRDIQSHRQLLRLIE